LKSPGVQANTEPDTTAEVATASAIRVFFIKRNSFQIYKKTKNIIYAVSATPLSELPQNYPLRIHLNNRTSLNTLFNSE
ncbi:TPA: hypothetical protein ACHJ6T_004963, partial [Escherichia coli]